MWNAVVSSRFRFSSRGVSFKDCLVSSKFLSCSNQNAVNEEGSDALKIRMKNKRAILCEKSKK